MELKELQKLKIISCHKTRPAMYLCSNGVSYTAAQFAEILGVSPSSMRLRFKNWGIDHPQVFRKKSLKQIKMNRGSNLDHIVANDCVDKYKGRRTSKERRANLKKIPSCTEYEKGLYV